MTQALGMEVRWPDEGGVVFTETAERGMLHALRALAASTLLLHPIQILQATSGPCGTRSESGPLCLLLGMARYRAVLE